MAFLPRLAGTEVAMTGSFFCIVEIIFVLIEYNATPWQTDRMSSRKIERKCRIQLLYWRTCFANCVC
ncbi:hypothetical protein FGE25_22250 [Kosakonia sacchari]|nr:hypothetical protein FGE25_22250 [Kosakonia sacchari]